VAAVLALPVAFGAVSAAASMTEVPLAVPATSVRLTARVLGLLPIPITVGRFAGTLRYDPDAPGICSVQFVADVTSMQTGDPDRQRRLLGPDFMDAARYPTFAFQGRCSQDGGLSGQLELHGQVRPFALHMDRFPHRLVAEGDLTRAEWGITAWPILVGPTIHVMIAASVP